MEENQNSILSEHKLKDLHSAFFENAIETFVILDNEYNLVEHNIKLESMPVEQRRKVEKLLFENQDIKSKPRIAVYQRVMATGVPESIEEVNNSTSTDQIFSKMFVFKVDKGIGICILNITKNKLEIDNLKKANRQLINANKLLNRTSREMEEFSYIAAHDLKSPMTDMQILLNMLDDDQLIKPRAKPLLEITKQITLQLYNKIHALNDVIALKTVKNSKLEDIYFTSVFEDAKNSLSNESYDLDAIFNDDFSFCEKVKYNRNHLRLLLYHLFIYILSREQKDAPIKINISSNIDSDRIVLFVSDNGEEIDSNISDNLVYGQFQKAHSLIEGLGVGLYIIKTIVYGNGGQMEVVSDKSLGTHFKFYLT